MDKCWAPNLRNTNFVSVSYLTIIPIYIVNLESRLNCLTLSGKGQRTRLKRTQIVFFCQIILSIKFLN